MINFVVDESNIDLKQFIYVVYYLMRDFKEEYIISSEFKEGYINIFYGFSVIGKRGIYIPKIAETEKQRVCHSVCGGYEILSFENNINTPFFVNGESIIFNFDIFSISLYLISCAEEYETDKRDDKERFIAKFSQRSQWIDRPFFDINCKILYDAVKYLNKDIEFKQNDFKVMITHDVDNVNSRNKYIFLHDCKELLNNRSKPFKKRSWELLYDLSKNRYLKIRENIEIEKKYQAVSEFYFLQGIKHRFGRRYEISDIKEEIEYINDCPGHKIGIHTNYFSYDDVKKIKEEINAVEAACGKKIISSRNHYLRFSVPKTWEKLRQAGIIVDTTLGFSDVNGLRAGTVKSFVPFNLKTNSIINIYEVPLIIMDIVVMEKNIPFEDKWIEIKGLIDTAAEYNGSVSILWHQCMLAKNEYRLMYERILKYIRDNGGKFVTSDYYLKTMQEDIKYFIDAGIAEK